jgi:hypothetical protein
MKYICQLDYPDWLFVTRTGKPEGPEQDKGKTTTVSRSGCGLCSSIMVADRLLPESTFGLRRLSVLPMTRRPTIAWGWTTRSMLPPLRKI